MAASEIILGVISTPTGCCDPRSPRRGRGSHHPRRRRGQARGDRPPRRYCGDICRPGKYRQRRLGGASSRRRPSRLVRFASSCCTTSHSSRSTPRPRVLPPWCSVIPTAPRSKRAPACCSQSRQRRPPPLHAADHRRARPRLRPANASRDHRIAGEACPTPAPAAPRARAAAAPRRRGRAIRRHN